VSSKRLTPDESARLIEMKLDRVPVLRIAEELGCSTATVQTRWNKWLEDQEKELGEKARRHHQLVLERLDKVAADARAGHRLALNMVGRDDDGNEYLAPDLSAAARFLAEERQAMKEYARLAGMDHAQRLEVSGPKGGPIEVVDPKVALRELLAASAPATPGCAEDESLAPPSPSSLGICPPRWCPEGRCHRPSSPPSTTRRATLSALSLGLTQPPGAHPPVARTDPWACRSQSSGSGGAAMGAPAVDPDGGALLFIGGNGADGSNLNRVEP
jgi:hypothetical protein